MFTRRSLRLPIILAVVMIVLLIVLTVGWVLLNVFGALANSEFAGVYWALLSIGSTFILLLVAGVVVYLLLTVKEIQLNRRQSNFVDSVTHELKSPIASLKLCLQTLGRRQLRGEEQADFYRYMLDDVERLDLLINQVLIAGRIEAGELHGEVEDIDLPTALREAAQMACIRYRVPPETVALELEPCVVRAPRLDIDLVFRNLLDNAVKYSGSPPRVRVAGRCREREIIVEVADNGPGIPPHLRNKVFGRFVRLGVELVREKPGTGLGLYIVRDRVRGLRGSVRVIDSPDAVGAVFQVRLPRGDAA